MWIFPNSMCSASAQGGGGLDLGLELAISNVRTVCWVEWEAFAIDYLATRMEAECLHPAPIFTDLRTFDGRPWRGTVDCLTAGYPCFAAGTMVLTESGYRPIEAVAVGDRVLTHRGRWRPVTAAMQRDNVALRQINAQGCPGIITTDEHPFYARMQGRRSEKGRYIRIHAQPDWTPASELEPGKHFVSQVLPDERRDQHTPEFWWIIGRYLACGYLQHRKSRGTGCRVGTQPAGRTVITCGYTKAGECEKGIEAAGFHTYREDGRTAVKFHITKTSLYKFLLPFGHLAHGKRLPGWVFSLDPVRARALIDGYLAGDGCRERRSRRANSTSKALALSIALLAQRAYGVVCSVRHNAKEPTCVIEGRTVNQRPYWTVDVPDHNRSAFIDKQYGWKLVRQNSPCGAGTVYNIAVEDDESYVADGAVVHNCQPFSVAGRRGGANDPRHLWPHVHRVIGEVEPSIVFLENVGGHLSLGAEQVFTELQGLGYEVAAGLFTAEEVGASHKRERLFILGLADAEHAAGRRPTSERQSEQRTVASGTGGTLVNDSSERRREGRPEHEVRGRPSPSGPVADADGPRRQGREDAGADCSDATAERCRREQSVRDGCPVADADREQRSLSGRPGEPARCGEPSDVGRTVLSAFPPGPKAAKGWEGVPYYLWPATEPALCELAHGLAVDRSRWLRLLGNGVVPLQAAYAFLSLFAVIRSRTTQ